MLFVGKPATNSFLKLLNVEYRDLFWETSVIGVAYHLI